MAMKYFLLTTITVLLSASLTSCVSLPEISNTEVKKDAKEYTGRLPPQNLLPGTCGLFVWSADSEQTFIGFETNDHVKLILGGKHLEGRRISKAGVSFPDRTYNLQNSDNVAIEVSVSLIEDKEIAEGTRYYGRLKSVTENGWERLTPIVALYSCASDA